MNVCKREIKAVIFDMDGVLVNSEPLYRQINDAYFASLGFSVTDELYNTFVGIGAKTMWQILIDTFNLPKTTDEYIAEKRTWKLKAFVDANLCAIDFVPELLQLLKDKNIKIGLASSSSRDVIDVLLNKIGIFSFFEVIVSGNEVKNGKPAPDIFLHAAQLLHTNPLNCAVLEDSKNGVAAAKSAEMFTIGFVNPDSGNQDLALADVRINYIKDACGYVFEN